MPSKTLFYSKGILRSDLKRLWWMPLLATLLFFLDKPLSILNQLTFFEQSAMPQDMDLYHNLHLFYYCYPVLIGAMLFRYLHTSKTTSFFHTLPVTRGQLFRTKLISLWLFSLLPVLINWGIMIVIFQVTPLSSYLGINEIHDFYRSIILVHLAMCGFSVFAATITGNTAGMIAASLGLPLLPTILVEVVKFALDALLKGFAGFPSSFQDVVNQLIPVLQIDSSILFQLGEFVLLTILAFWLYRSYSTERAGDLITVTWMRPIFLFGVTLCSIIAGLAYATASYYNIFGTALTMGITTILGFSIATALLIKSLRVWTEWKRFFLYVAIILVSFGVLRWDPMGYQTKIPTISEVKAVSYGIMSLPTNQKEIDQYYGYHKNSLFTEPENIEKVLSLHQEAMHQAVNPREMEKIYFTYLLTDGSQIKRAYYLFPDQDKELRDTKEYRISSNSIFRIPEEEVLSISLYQYSYDPETKTEEYQQETSIRHPDDIKQLMTAVKQDLLEQDLSQETSYELDFQVADDNQFVTRASITNGTHTKAFIEEYNARTK